MLAVIVIRRWFGASIMIIVTNVVFCCSIQTELIYKVHDHLTQVTVVVCICPVYLKISILTEFCVN
jgi:hypothetical protein